MVAAINQGKCYKSGNNDLLSTVNYQLIYYELKGNVIQR